MGFDDVSTGSTWSDSSGAPRVDTLVMTAIEPILEHVRELDAVARRALAPLQERYACIGDVRVTGCFIGIEFVKDRLTKERDLDLMERVALGCLNRGLLVDASTASMNLQPSLVTPADVLERGIAIVDVAIAEALGSSSA